MVNEPLLPQHGGYRNLRSFQIAQLCYDVTIRFCERYVPKRNRTYDQMVQAARSGVQNIAEGSKASGTSKRTELKLTNVACASLEELRLDYEDFLRHRGLTKWQSRDGRATALIARRCTSADAVADFLVELHERERGGRSGQDGHRGRDGLHGHNGQDGQRGPSTYAELAANAALVLIRVACSLLDRQLEAQARAFELNGGFTERLQRVRRNARRDGSGS